MGEEKVALVEREVETKTIKKVETENAKKVGLKNSKKMEKEVKEEDFADTIPTGSGAADPRARSKVKLLESSGKK